MPHSKKLYVLRVLCDFRVHAQEARLINSYVICFSSLLFLFLTLASIGARVKVEDRDKTIIAQTYPIIAMFGTFRIQLVPFKLVVIWQILTIFDHFTCKFRFVLGSWFCETVMLDLCFHFSLCKLLLLHLLNDGFKKIKGRVCYSLLDVLEQ